MPHDSHSVFDSDSRFIIDPASREIKNTSGKTTLAQHDHNSERITFEIPRFIDSHDMSLCDSVQIHYLNVDSATKDKSPGTYDVDDLQVSAADEDKVICSWLISANATKYTGKLNFVVRFACTENGNVLYAWHTGINSDLTVSSVIYNSDEVAEEYADILAQWKAEIDAAIAEIPAGGGGSGSSNSIIYSGGEITDETAFVIDPEATADKVPEIYNGILVNAAGFAEVSGSAAGDYYINIATYDVFHATAANTWERVCNIKGANGSTGIFFGAYDGTDGEPPEDAVLWIDPAEAADMELITTDSLATALTGINNQIQYCEDSAIKVLRLGNILFQWGFSQFSGTTDVKTAKIYFSTALGTYAVAPHVVHADSSSTPQYVHTAIGGTTTAEFTAHYVKTNSAGTINFRWLAVGTVAE